MSDSIMIEVDEVTQSIMSELQEQLRTGTLNALEESFEQLNQMSSLLRESSTRIDSLRRNMDDFSFSIQQLNSRIGNLGETTERQFFEVASYMTQVASTIESTAGTMGQIQGDVATVQATLQQTLENSVLFQNNLVNKLENVGANVDSVLASNRELNRVLSLLEQKVKSLESTVHDLQGGFWKRLFNKKGNGK